MRVTYIHQYFTTPSRGGGTRSFEMARRLVAAGHQVSLITTQQEPSDSTSWFITNESGIQVHWLPVPYSNKMSNGRRMVAFLKFALASALRAASIESDVVFATSTPLTVAIPGIYASWRRRIPMVFEVRDMWPDVPIALGAIRQRWMIWVAKKLEMLAYRHAKHVVALAPGMKDDIVRKGIAPNKVTVIPNGCDLELFGETSASQPSVRLEFPWLGDRPLVICAGTLGRVHGLSYLVHVARHAVKLHADIRFVVIGNGAERDRVVKLAEEFGLFNVNVFFFAKVSKTEVARWVKAADIIACMITGPREVWKDAVQNKFFDAVAAGKPTASNFEGFQSKLAVENKIGIILSPEDPKGAADQLVAALENSQWLSEVPARSRVLAHGEFNRDYLGAQLLGVLERAISKG